VKEQRNQRPVAAAGQRPGLIAAYAPIAGVPDEMLGPDGLVRPAWRPLIAALDALGDGLEARFERADQYLRDAGVYYRKYDSAEGKERSWPLAHVPPVLG
jgi:uncharacterized circularly permuted ATP-grasp superfamily protein